MARPQKYRPEYAYKAYELCSIFGADDKKLAAFFKVDKATIERWKIRHTGFCDSVKKGKDEYDVKNVEASLLKRALGYRYNEVHKQRASVIVNGEVVFQEGFETKIIRKEVAPDVTAQIFYLKNRNRDRWREKQEVGVDGNITIKVVNYAGAENE